MEMLFKENVCETNRKLLNKHKTHAIDWSNGKEILKGQRFHETSLRDRFLGFVSVLYKQPFSF